MRINPTGSPVLCDSHKGAHNQTLTCKYPTRRPAMVDDTIYTPAPSFPILDSFGVEDWGRFNYHYLPVNGRINVVANAAGHAHRAAFTVDTVEEIRPKIVEIFTADNFAW